MIEQLWAGSWINHDFSTWIGEEEENVAWEYLVQTRGFSTDVYYWEAAATQPRSFG
jgi:alpha-amylase/alpha-mannosidase (GH57 family)